MQEGTTQTVSLSSTTSDALTEILRQGAQRMLATAIEAEAADWIERHSHLWMRTATARSFATGICRNVRSRPAWERLKSNSHAFTIGVRASNGTVYVEDSATLLTEDEEHRRTHTVAIPQGSQHERFFRGVGGVAGPGCPWVERLHRDSTEELLGGRISRVEQAIAGRQAIRLRVGGWHSFQHSTRGRPAVHSGSHGSHGRGQEGIDCGS